MPFECPEATKGCPRGGFETAAKPSALLMPPTGKVEPNTPRSDFDASGTDFLGLPMRRGRSDVGDPVGAAGDCEGMRTNRGHVFVESRSPVGERRMHFGADRNDLFGGLSDQAGEKRRGVFRRSYCHLSINVFRDLFDRKKDWEDQAEERVREDNVIGGELEDVGSPSGRRSLEASRSRSILSG